MSATDELSRKAESGYASVNGLEMYYEIHGTGRTAQLQASRVYKFLNPVEHLSKV